MSEKGMPLDPKDVPGLGTTDDTSSHDLSPLILPDTPSDILKKDGITDDDLEPLRRLQDQGFSIFLHGSGITDRLSATSDIDFAIIGSLTSIPADIRRKFLPGVQNRALEKIDYVSAATQAANGRKMSLHLENPEFRDGYTDRPYALEFRHKNNAKKTGRSMYVMGGIDQDGTIRLFNLTCQQTEFAEGFINVTPQTGIYYVDGSKMIASAEAHADFDMESLATVENGQLKTTTEIPDGTRLMVAGVELNKMCSDAALNLTGMSDEERFVLEPMRRSLEMIGRFIGQEDPIEMFLVYMRNHSYLRSHKDGRKRVGEQFLAGLHDRLIALQAHPLSSQAHVEGQ